MSTSLALAAIGLACVFAAAPAARQTGEVVLVGEVSVLAGSGGVADVSITVFGPMEGQAVTAIASFPTMVAEISERLSIPYLSATTDRDGRFRVALPEPGLYSVLAKRAGYVGPATPGTPPTSLLVTATVTVTPKEPAEVLLYMVPGVITPQLPAVRTQ